jgi:hypothetical protein
MYKGQEIGLLDRSKWDRYVDPKRRYVITALRCVTPQKSTGLIYIAAEVWNHPNCSSLLCSSVRGIGQSVACVHWWVLCNTTLQGKCCAILTCKEDVQYCLSRKMCNTALQGRCCAILPSKEDVQYCLARKVLCNTALQGRYAILSCKEDVQYCLARKVLFNTALQDVVQ